MLPYAAGCAAAPVPMLAGASAAGAASLGGAAFSYAVKRSAWLCSVACETHKTLTTPDRTHTLEMHARHADELQPR